MGYKKPDIGVDFAIVENGKQKFSLDKTYMRFMTPKKYQKPYKDFRKNFLDSRIPFKIARYIRPAVVLLTRV